MTPQQSDPTLFSSLKLLLEALPNPVPDYCLIGGLALGAWGQVRATQDIDLLIMLDETQRTRLLGLLEPFGFILDVRWAEVNPLLKGRMTRLRHSGYPVDLLVPQDAQEAQTLSRRRSVQLGDFSVWVCGPEDLILLKLKAGRPRDFEDVLSVIQHQGDKLDVSYLWTWADRFGLQSELHYVLGAGQPPG